MKSILLGGLQPESLIAGGNMAIIIVAVDSARDNKISAKIEAYKKQLSAIFLQAASSPSLRARKARR
jgi:hypothetical protein